MLGITIDYFLVALTSMIVIINPISSGFIFLSLLPNATLYQKKLVARRSIFIAGSILIFFVLTGKYFFSLFGITIGAFRIAGGIILFGIAMGMLSKVKGEHDVQYHISNKQDLEDIALIPLAIPFMSGPGSIATVTLLTAEAPNFYALAFVIVAILVVMAACYYSMFYSQQLVRFIGNNGRRISTRIFGLILAVISVQFVVNGVIDVLPEAVNIVINEV